MPINVPLILSKIKKKLTRRLSSNAAGVELTCYTLSHSTLRDNVMSKSLLHCKIKFTGMHARDLNHQSVPTESKNLEMSSFCRCLVLQTFEDGYARAAIGRKEEFLKTIGRCVLFTWWMSRGTVRSFAFALIRRRRRAIRPVGRFEFSGAQKKI